MHVFRSGIALGLGFLLMASVGTAEDARQPHPLVAATNGYVLASSANLQGAFGAYFKTRVTLMNPNLSTMKIDVYAATPSGLLPAPAVITLAAGSGDVWPNFLDDQFHYTGGAALLFQTDPSSIDPNAPFLLTAEVYVETTSGRYGTALSPLGPSDRISSSIDAGISVSPGVVIDANNRANVGCVNFDTSPATIAAVLVGNSTQLWSNTFSLQAGQWEQLPVGLSSVPVAAAVSFRSVGPPRSLYCYAVNVNNGSNDGTQIPAIHVVPSAF